MNHINNAGTKRGCIFLQNNLGNAYNALVMAKGRCLHLFWWACSFLSLIRVSILPGHLFLGRSQASVMEGVFYDLIPVVGG